MQNTIPTEALTVVSNLLGTYDVVITADDLRQAIIDAIEPRAEMTMKRGLSPQQVADRLGVCRKSVLRAIADGRLPAHRLSKRTLRVPEDALRVFAGDAR